MTSGAFPAFAKVGAAVPTRLGVASQRKRKGSKATRRKQGTKRPAMGSASSPGVRHKRAPTVRAQARHYFGRLSGTGLLALMLRGFMTVAALTLLAKAVSFFKDAAVAHRFGIVDALDAFMLAFGTHTFAVSLLGGGIPEAFLPVYARLKHERTVRRAERLGVQTALSYLAALGVLALVIVAAGPALVRFLGNGFPAAKQALALGLMRDLLPFLFCYGLTLHLGMWLRGNKLFAVAAAAPLLTPGSILLGIALTQPDAGIKLLVWGTNIGSALHLLVLMIVVGRRLPWSWRWVGSCFRLIEPGNRQVLASATPYLLAGLALCGAPMVDQAMAARLDSGSVAVLSYSDKVCSILLALTAGAASEALFPFFADLVARRDWAGVKRKLQQVIGGILAVAVPLVALLCWLAPLVVALLFERGRFDAEDTARVAAVLRYAALQIPFYIASVLMSRVVVALQASWFTLAAAMFSLGANVFFNALFMRYLGVAGIALSTALVYLLSCVMLGVYLLRALRRMNHPTLEARA